jgi:hypothetical protein
MKALIAGAQTERRGEAGPVRVLLRGWGRTGRFVLRHHHLKHRATSQCVIEASFVRRNRKIILEFQFLPSMQ